MKTTLQTQETLSSARDSNRVTFDHTEWAIIAKANANWLTALGVLELILGLIAVLAPFLAGITTTIVLGTLLLIAGLVRLVRGVKAEGFGQGIFGHFIPLVSVVCGGIMLARPLIGLGSLTLLLGSYFLIQGLSSIVLSLQVRPHTIWHWLLLDGLVTSFLALVILIQWPFSGAWVLGTLVGIDLLISGWAFVSIGRELPNQLEMSASVPGWPKRTGS